MDLNFHPFQLGVLAVSIFCRHVHFEQRPVHVGRGSDAPHCLYYHWARVLLRIFGHFDLRTHDAHKEGSAAWDGATWENEGQSTASRAEYDACVTRRRNGSRFSFLNFGGFFLTTSERNSEFGMTTLVGLCT